MDDTFDSLHQKQKIFLQKSQSDYGKKFIELNALEDISCWSESKREESIKVIINQEDICDQPSVNSDLVSSCKLGMTLDISNEQSPKFQFSASQRVSLFSQIQDKSPLSHNDRRYSSQSGQSRQIVELKFRKDESNISGFIKDKSYFSHRVGDSSQKKVELINYSNLKLINYIKTKIRRFYKLYTINGRTSMLNQSIRYQLNDLSDFGFSQGKKNTITKITKYIKFFTKLFNNKYIPRINPSSSVGFSILVALSLLNSIFLYLFSCIIVFSAEGEWIFQLMIFIKVIWCLEIWLKCYTDPQVEIENKESKNKVAFTYLNQKAAFDLIPLIILFFHLLNYYHPILDLFIFLKFNNLITDINEIQRRLCMVIQKYYLVQLSNLIIKLFFIGHIIACMWYLLGVIEIKYFHEEQTWFKSLEDFDKTWWKLYVWSIYWALTLMTTGSNVASTVSQACFTSFIMLFITIAFGYMLNIIGSILQQIDETHLQQRKDINLINEYMRIRNISKNLQAKVNLNLEYYYNKNFQKSQEHNREVLQKISKDLQDQIMKEANKQIFNKINLLTSNFSAESLEELQLFVKEEYYFPNQTIIKEGEVYDSSMIYIISGTVELNHPYNTDQKRNNPLKRITKGDIFGEVGFFTGLGDPYCAKSTEFTKIIKIDRQSFLDIIKKNETDYEMYCQIKDNILLYQKYSDLNVICNSCKLSSHLIIDCSLTHFNKQRAYLQSGAYQSRIQTRTEYQRKIIYKKKTLKLLKTCFQSAYDIRDNYSTSFTDFRMGNLDKLEQSSKNEENNSWSSNNDDDDDDDDIEDGEDYERILDNNSLSENAMKENQITKVRDDLLAIIGHANSDLQQQVNQNMNNNELMLKTQQLLTKEISILCQDNEEIVSQENLKSIVKEINENQQQSSQIEAIPNNQRIEISKNSTRDIQYPSYKDLSRLLSNKDNQKNAQNNKATKHFQNQQNQKSSTQIRSSDIEQTSTKPTSSQGKRKFQNYSTIKIETKKHLGNLDRRTSLYNLQQQLLIFNEKYFSKINQTYDADRFFNPWNFEMLKDYQFYYPTGNSKNQIFQHTKFIKKKKMKDSKKDKIKK